MNLGDATLQLLTQVPEIGRYIARTGKHARGHQKPKAGKHDKRRVKQQRKRRGR